MARVVVRMRCTRRGTRGAAGGGTTKASKWCPMTYTDQTFMQVCHFFATTGCKHPQNCTKGCHDDNLVLPHLDSIVCKVLALQGECTNKHCTKSHFKPVVDRFRAEVAKQQQKPKQRLPSQQHHQPMQQHTAIVPVPNHRPASALVRAQPPPSSVNCSALVAKLQGMGMVAVASKPEQSKTEMIVKQKRRKTNVIVALDISGSMRGEKMNNAKLELGKLWHLLDKGDSLTIVTFSGTVSVAMPRRFKCELKAGQTKRDTQFDEADFRAVIDALKVSHGTALYDAVAAALQLTQQACEDDMRKHPDSDWHTFQLLVITDGEDYSSTSATAASVNNTLLHPGAWAGKCRFSSCFVAIGAQAAHALAQCTAGLKHSVTVSDIDAGFRRLTETVAQVRTTTVQQLKKSAFAWGGS